MEFESRSGRWKEVYNTNVWKEQQTVASAYRFLSASILSYL